MSSDKTILKNFSSVSEQERRDAAQLANDYDAQHMIRNRIFMNHVDQYNARHIAEFLTDQTMGVLKSGKEDVADEGAEEVQEEEEEDLQEKIVAPMTIKGDKYEIIGTLKFPFGRKNEDVLYTVSEADPKLFENELLDSGFVVYDISIDPGEVHKALASLNLICDQIDAVKAVGPKTFSRYDRVFVFVLITNFMTWAKTKPVDPNEPEIPFSEADYKKRKAHPNYQKEIECEREVLKKGRMYKENLRTYVICSGIPYGFEEEDLLFFFKQAWLNKDLPQFGLGANFIPLIHVQDLAKVLHGILEFQPRKPNYILAVEQIPSRLGKIVRALARSMGRGAVVETSKENAFLYNNMTQRLYDMLTVNLRMEPAYMLDELGVEYRNDLNFVQNITNIVEEFRVARNLNPLRILVHGPIFSGKTTLCKELADFYGVHYVNVGDMIRETCEGLRERIEREVAAAKAKMEKPQRGLDEDDEEESDDDVDEEDEDEGVVDLETMRKQLADIETALEKSPNHKLPDEYVIRLMNNFLASNICQNQGYVLDGYPFTMEQTKDLFGSQFPNEPDDPTEADDDLSDISATPKRSTAPQVVISLEANDSFLINRVLGMEEKDTNGTKYEEIEMLDRLKRFRQENTEDKTLLNFFDEREVHPIIFNVMEEKEDNMAVFRRLRAILGGPVGFEASQEEQEEMQRCQQEAEALKAEQDRIEKEILERKQLEEYQRKMEERIRILDKLQTEEEKLLAVQCEPLRNYLMMHIFPTLTQGLLEVARIKPEDPIDYLAEYLFKCNPEGKMFDPAYTRQGELIIDLVTKDVPAAKKAKKRLIRLCK